jgi:hypothetical protein
MTDYSELIRKARAVPGPTLLMTYPAQTTPDPLSNALADAIEEQAKEIAEKDARIAELEAALKPLVECVTHIRDSAEYDPNHRRHLITQSLWSSLCTQLKTARAALEKK